MSELRSAVDGLRATVPEELSDAAVEEVFLEIHRGAEQLELERLRFLAEVERRQIHMRDGHLSTASWLAAKTKTAWGAARQAVVLARGLDEMPRTREALAAGDVSLSAATALAHAREADPAIFDRDEPLLLEAARKHSIADLQKVTAYWRQRAERERDEESPDAMRERRTLCASVTIGGMVRVDGDLDPETGESLLTALRAVLDAEARNRTDDDGRTPAQRRADALGEVCRGWLDRSDRPMVAGERPHVSLTLDVDALTRLEGTSELDHTGPVSEGVARQLICDASIRRVVLSSRSEPLDVGRRTPVVSPAMRRAAILRDRHCRFPGCDRPHTWCDAHHVQHWADCGPTSIANLLLLCRRHHRLVHECGGFTLRIEDDRPVFRRPDGSMLEDRAPPLISAS